jgi:hypothetical protein
MNGENWVQVPEYLARLYWILQSLFSLWGIAKRLRHRSDKTVCVGSNPATPTMVKTHGFRSAVLAEKATARACRSITLVE